MHRILAALCCTLAPIAAGGAELHVGADQAFTTVAAAVAAANTGDTVTVHGGTYQDGNLLVDKSITLIGIGDPVLDGGGKSEVVTITAPDVRISGFVVRNTGRSSLSDLAGIRVSGTRGVTIEKNTVHDCNFGIYLANAHFCQVLDNEVRGTPGGEQDSGNGIHLWSSDHITINDNRVRDQRDGIYLEFTTDTTAERNTVEDNLRYGLHFMFSHGNAYRKNSFIRNGAGVAVMYSRNVEMTANHFAFNWGAASYGLLLKEMTDGSITGNTFEHNTAGISMHGSNRMTLERNGFAQNGWAIQIQSNSTDNTFRDNNFSGNSFDIAAEGELENNLFENNYWDKYEGYDLNRDGTGDIPFRPVSLYATVVSRVPPAILLLRSPIVHLLDQAEKAFPSVTPERVFDNKPRMHPHRLPPFQPPVQLTDSQPSPRDP